MTNKHTSLERSVAGKGEPVSSPVLMSDMVASEQGRTMDWMKAVLMDLSVALREGQSVDPAFVQILNQTDDLLGLDNLFKKMVQEVLDVSSHVRHLRADVLLFKQKIAAAENRNRYLEAQLRNMNEQVREDQLTGSLNRRGIDEVFEREIARAERGSLSLSVAMIDVDNFKQVNDSYGHDVGDNVLIYLISVLKETLRKVDIVGRFGGEEFIIFLPDTSLEDAALVITRLQKELANGIFLHNHERIMVTFSAGVVSRVSKEEQVSLVRRADEALYRAKLSGKNRVIAVK